MPISTQKENVEKHLLNLDPPTIQTRMLLKNQRGLLKKNLNSHKKEQPGQKSQEKVSLEDLTLKVEHPIDLLTPAARLLLL